MNTLIQKEIKKLDELWANDTPIFKKETYKHFLKESLTTIYNKGRSDAVDYIDEHLSFFQDVEETQKLFKEARTIKE